MKKKILGLIAAIICIGMIGCGNSTESHETVLTETTENNVETQEQTQEQTTSVQTISIGVPTAPPALPILYMMENNTLGDSVEISIDIWSEPESLIAMVQDDSHDIFAFPLTVISKLYNKGMDVRLLNVNTWGVTYFMTSDPEFDSWDDLKGKTVYIPLQSSPPDALTQFFIDEAGLEVGKDVEIVYASTTEVATLLASGEAVYGTLIEPQVTKAMMGNENLRVAFSFENEWQRVTGTETMIPNAGMGTTQSFINENPELVESFQVAYEEALDWVNENPAEAAVLAEKYLGLNATLVEKSIPNMGLTYKSAEDAKTELDMFYELLNDFDASMIGGKIADDGLYY